MTENLFIPTKITTELAEEIGWHIGDGSMNYYNNHGTLKGIYQLRGHIEDDREHYEKIIKPLFKLIYDLDISLRKMPSTRVYGFQIWSNKLIKFKKDLGLPLGKKLDIIIPKKVLTNNELKIAVIRGIFDTDGGIQLMKKNRKLYPIIYITTISEDLSKQLLNILNGLGLRTTSYNWLSLNPNYNRQRAYKVLTRGEIMFHKFMSIIKPANPKHIRKYNLFKESFK